MAGKHPESTATKPQRAKAETKTRTGVGGSARAVPTGIGSKLSLLQIIAILFISSTAWAAEELRPVEVRSEMIWEETGDWFGGLSGIEILADGQRIAAITDRGQFIQADMIRENGVLRALKVTKSIPIRNAKGKILERPFTDAEGLAVGQDGQVYISFEGQHRIAMLDTETGITRPLPRLEASKTYADNAGLEAVAITPDGIIMTVAEQSDTQEFPLFAFQNNAWRIAAQIPRRGPFLPVGADFDAQGRFYLLERTVTPLGFRSRIRRFDINAPTLSEETLYHTLPSRFDNLEAISVWQDSSGRTSLTLVSDDNFLPIQNTQVIEFSLTD